MGGIWIRSQDREALLYAQYIWAVYSRKRRWVIYTNNPTGAPDDPVILGEYEGHIAFDVLDQIQDAIENKRTVFEMPEKYT